VSLMLSLRAPALAALPLTHTVASTRSDSFGFASLPRVEINNWAPLASQLRKVSADSVLKWRKSLDAIAKASKRGEQAVAMRRTILAALTSNTETEYRAWLAELPVSVAVTPSSLDGVAGEYRTYRVRGRVQHTIFVRHQQPSALPFGGPSAEDTPTGLANSQGKIDCSATWQGVEYTGECATQSEIDDALAILTAMDYEVAADFAAAQAECTVVYLDDVVCNLYESGGELTGTEAARTDAVGGPFVSDVAITSSAPVECAVSAEGKFTCVTQAIAAVGDTFGWLATKVGAYYLVAAEIPPPALAVGIAVGAALYSGYAAGMSILAYYNCRHAQ